MRFRHFSPNHNCWTTEHYISLSYYVHVFLEPSFSYVWQGKSEIIFKKCANFDFIRWKLGVHVAYLKTWSGKAWNLLNEILQTPCLRVLRMVHSYICFLLFHKLFCRVTVSLCPSIHCAPPAPVSPMLRKKSLEWMFYYTLCFVTKIDVWIWLFIILWAFQKNESALKKKGIKITHG